VALGAAILGLMMVPGSMAATGPDVTVDLVAERSVVQAGRPFWVGLHFQLEQGWHIYWTNPGDSGEPPRVTWSLPAGFQAGSLQWAIPRRIEDHSLIDYGYLNDVLLPVEITPATGLAAMAEVQLRATVKWLVCREICIPGKADLSLALPVRAGAPGDLSPQSSLFATALAALPRPAPASWKATASLEPHGLALVAVTGKRETVATFFPLERGVIENAAPQKASTLAGGIRVEMQRSDQMVKSPSRLAGVLVFSSGQGYLIDAPIIGSH
jgi:thiol:disulfide interchange protein DsbD